MTDREALVAQLIDHEGLRLKIYKDTLGIETIGVGRNLRTGGITREEALYLLGNDLDDCILDLALFPWFPPLDAVRQRAVIDLRFALGHDGFRFFREFIAAMARKNYPRASLEIQTSKWAFQVQQARVLRLRAMIETGTD